MDELHILSSNLDYAVQSSGMGKSKTGQDWRNIVGASHGYGKVGRLINTFPVYPPPTLEPVITFSNAPSTRDDVVECKQYLRHFLSSLFASERHLSQQLFPADKMIPYERMARTFYNFFADPLYEQVVGQANQNSDINIRESFDQLMARLKRCSDWPTTP